MRARPFEHPSMLVGKINLHKDVSVAFDENA